MLKAQLYFSLLDFGSVNGQIPSIEKTAIKCLYGNTINTIDAPRLRRSENYA